MEIYERQIKQGRAEVRSLEITTDDDKAVKNTKCFETDLRNGSYFKISVGQRGLT